MTYTYDGSHDGVPHHAVPQSLDVERYYQDMRDDLLHIDIVTALHDVVTVAEAATMSGLSKSAVLKAWHRGCFAGRMAGRTLLISHQSFVNWYTEE